MLHRRHTVAVLPGPAQPAAATAKSCLELVARKVKAKPGQTIVLARQKDQALMWKAAAVHPLQALETEYQGIVHDAGRGEHDATRRRDAESAAMADFFIFDSGAPRLMGVVKGQPYLGEKYPIMEDRLRHAQKELDRVAKAIAGGKISAESSTRRLHEILKELRAVVAAFAVGSGSSLANIPYLADANKKLDEAELLFNWDSDSAQTIPSLKAAGKQLEQAFTDGVASVQMFHTIEGFYLFRLLVRYHIESGREISENDVTEASKALTGTVNGPNITWLNEWLTGKIVALGKAIAAADPSGRTVFFLKGGRAVAYLEKKPDTGENDWDTQILIDPTLPPAQWYSLLATVHNTVLLALKSFKMELFTVMQQNAAVFEQALNEPPKKKDDAKPRTADNGAPPVADAEQPLDDDDDDLLGDEFRRNCKAELIDVGLPRYDTTEALEQWARLRNRILTADDGIPFPGFLYYVDEYVMMLREVISGANPGAKAGKRAKRLNLVLSSTDTELDEAIEEECEAVPQPLLDACRDRVTSPAAGRLLCVMLAQFWQAYGLSAEPEFAKAFGKFFLDNTANPKTLAQQHYANVLADINKDAPEALEVIEALCCCQWISDEMDKHLALRGAHLLASNDDVSALIENIYRSSIFSPKEELELQMAIAGSYAAFLQADYTRFARPQEIEPVTKAAIRLYARNPDAKPAEVMALVTPVIKQCVQARQDLFTLVEPATPGDPLRIFWAQPVTIAPFTYAPLAFEISVGANVGGWPLLSYVWDLPVLALRNLILEYRHAAAETEEFSTRAKLKTTGAALVEILTRAENPEPKSQPIGSYLMISSSDYAIGAGADYPLTYYVPRS